MQTFLIINKYVSLDELENRTNNEDIIKQIGSVKMFSKLNALENSEEFLKQEIDILKRMLMKTYNVPFAPAFVINGLEY